ncbi:MAG: NAD(P)-binding protein [Flavobacteriales bacterium]|nr:NAD(P)-binding protein [Flavobacteriales bacterium]
MQKQSKYDIVIIGSSPLMLIESLYQAKLGKSVLVIEKQERIGGAWQSFEKINFSNHIEIGSHIWQKDKSVNEFLINSLGINVVEMSPQPVTIGFGFTFPYYAISIFYSLRHLRFNSLFDFENVKLHRSLWFDFFKQFLNPSKYYYHEGGSGELIQKLAEKATNCNVRFELNTSVDQIDLSSNTLLTLYGSEIKFETLIGTNKLDINNVTLSNGLKTPISLKPRTSYSLYLVVKCEHPSLLSYAETYKDKVIYRVSDITYTDSRLRAEKKRLYCIDLTYDGFNKHQEPELVDIALRTLIQWEVLPKGTLAKNHFIRTYNYNGQSNEVVNDLSIKTNPNLVFLESNNLIPSLAKQIDRWKTQL